MAGSPLKERIGEDTKATMRARDARRLGVMRLVNSEIKRVEVDERRMLDDGDVIVVLERMLKQRADSQRQFLDAHRTDLADQEAFEIGIIRAYMPAPLAPEELAAFIATAVAECGATSPRDMGAVMALLKPRIVGRADMKGVSALVRQALAKA